MQFTLERLTDATEEPITLAEAKQQLRSYGSDTSEDTLITGLVTTAREWAEDYTARALMDQTWRLSVVQILPPGALLPTIGPMGYWVPGMYFGSFCWHQRRGQILLRRGPVLSIASLVTVDADGVETTVDATAYRVRDAGSKWPMVVPTSGATWFNGDFRITFRAGYADTTASPAQGAEMVPARFKQAIKLHAEANYDRDPQTMPQLLKAAEDLLKPLRVELSVA